MWRCRDAYIYLGGRRRYSCDRRSRLGGFRPSLSHRSRHSSRRSSPSYYSPSRRLPLPDTARWIPSTIGRAQRPTKGGRAFVSRIPISPESRILCPISMKSHISVALLLKAVFFFFLAQHTNPVLKALGMWRRVGAHARKIRTGRQRTGRGLAGLFDPRGERHWILPRAGDELRCAALHFYGKVRSSGSFVFTLKRRYFTELIKQVMFTFVIKVKIIFRRLPRNLNFIYHIYLNVMEDKGKWCIQWSFALRISVLV